MKFLVGLLIAGLLVSESHGLRRSIFRKCQQSGVTFPTCEAGERLGYFRNTCDEVVSGNFGKLRLLWVSLGSIRCLQVPKCACMCLQVSPSAFRCLQVPSGVFRCFQVLSGAIKCHWVP